MSISVFIVLSTVFHSINSPDDSPFSDSVLPFSDSVLFCSYLCLIGPFNYISLSKSLLRWFQKVGAFAVRCDPCRGREGSWRLRYPLAAACWDLFGPDFS